MGIAVTVVLPVAGNLTKVVNGTFVAVPNGLKSCAKRTLAFGSFPTKVTCTGTVAPAAGGKLLAIPMVATTGPMVSSVAKVAIYGWPTALLPARSNTLLTVNV